MNRPQFKFQVRGNYMDGSFQAPIDQSGEIIVRSPADLNDVVGQVPYSYQAVDGAVESARRAWKIWKGVAQSERANLLKRYQAALKRREEELVEMISREVGKPLWESKTEVSAMLNKVDITLNESARLTQDFEIPKILPQTQGVCRYRPLGVMAVIGPFNFPGHLPNGHIVPALLTGNTVVFKPSEKTPLIGQLIAECMDEAGFPKGVFNLVQGEKEVGRRLCIHEDVSGVLFTGSYEVGTRIKQDTLQQHWKLLALEMGGKNPVLVWDDAQLDVAIQESLVGAFLTTGQRCSATSRILVHQKLMDSFVSKFHERAKSFSIGHPYENPFMGPLVEKASVDRYTKFMGIASREGCEILMRGKAMDHSPEGYYVTPSICLVQNPSVEAAKKSVFQQTELFAPNVAITPISDLDEAIELANVTQYGLVASIFTSNRDIYEKCLAELEFGLINWNKSTVGASSKLPFGGTKKSGNHFPTALTANFYCTIPVASLEVVEPKLAESAYPGLNWA